MKLLYEDQWLEIKLLEPKAKTKVLGVYSKCDGSELGIIHWYPPWRHYTFMPTTEFQTEHSDRCMIAIGYFIQRLNKKHKENRKNEKPT